MDCSFSRVSCEKSREREKELNGTRNCRNRRQKVLANGFRGLTLKLRVTVGQESVRERPKRVRRNKALALRTLSGLIALNLSHSLPRLSICRSVSILSHASVRGRTRSTRRSCELTIDTITRRTQEEGGERRRLGPLLLLLLLILTAIVWSTMRT